MFNPTKLIELRVRNGLSQNALGKAAGISHVHVRKLENGGIVKPRPDTVDKLAEALHVSPDVLTSQSGIDVLPPTIEDQSPNVFVTGFSDTLQVAQLLTAFVKLTPEGKSKLMEYADLLLRAGK